MIDHLNLLSKDSTDMMLCAATEDSDDMMKLDLIQAGSEDITSDCLLTSQASDICCV